MFIKGKIWEDIVKNGRNLNQYVRHFEKFTTFDNGGFGQGIHGMIPLGIISGEKLKKLLGRF